MKTDRGIKHIFVFFIAVLLLLPAVKGAHARVLGPGDIRPQDSRVLIPGNIGDLLNPGGDGPGQPTPSPTPDDPASHLDANDYLSALFMGELKLNVNGLEMEPLLQNSVLRFRVTPVAETSAATINFMGIRTNQTGRYEIFLSDFDEAEFQASLLIESIEGNREYKLRPGSQVSFTANRLEAMIFDGTEMPEPGAKVIYQIEIDDSKVTYVVEHVGDLVVEAHQHPSFRNPLPEVPVNPTPNQPVEPQTPNVVGPVGGDTGGDAAAGPEGIPIFDDMGGQLGGGGCSLQSTSTGNLLVWLLPLLGFLTWGFALRSRD